MKKRIISAILVLALGVAFCPAKFTVAAPVGTAFTYQGHLYDNNDIANGLYDFQFKLHDADSGDSQVGSDVNEPDVNVINGYFTVELDFGSDPNSFNGNARWLEIGVRPGDMNDPNSYTPLEPRQKVMPSPYALALPGLRTRQSSTSPDVIGGYPGNVIPAGVVGTVISGGGASGVANRAVDDYCTIGGGIANLAGDEGPLNMMYATVGGGRYNEATGANATIAGGWSNTASMNHVAIGGGWTNIGSDYYATVAGGELNTASRESASIGGGTHNLASGHTSVVSGGYYNTASNAGATVGGGWDNVASDQRATVAGGAKNQATAWCSTVGGGHENKASAGNSTVGGGVSNIASGSYATVPGGLSNTASGSSSLAAGRRAKAEHEGSFVWADSTDANFVSTDPNQFLIRASGGVGIGTTNPSTQLHVSGDVTITGDLSVGGSIGGSVVSMGKIYLSGNGTVISTDGGDRILYWDKSNGELEITNNTTDWCDYWWRAQKGGTSSGNASAVNSSTSNYVIISGTNSNDYGFEVHFGQADGTAGWCSVWLQYANGKLVGHYISY